MKNKLILFIVAGLLLWGTAAFAGLAFLGGGHRQVASGTFTQANARLSLVDGTAFFDCGADLSAYAGLDTGSHEYLIKVYDDDGYSIQGYVGAVGGGETLGAEVSAGTLVNKQLYKITATEENHFGTGLIVGEHFISVGSETCDANNKVQQLTDCAVTGFHIISAQGGSTQNWTSESASFNYNDSDGYSYKIWKVR